MPCRRSFFIFYVGKQKGASDGGDPRGTGWNRRAAADAQAKAAGIAANGEKETQTTEPYGPQPPEDLRHDPEMVRQRQLHSGAAAGPAGLCRVGGCPAAARKRREGDGGRSLVCPDKRRRCAAG